MAINKKLIRYKEKENFVNNGVNGNVSTPSSPDEEGDILYGQIYGKSIVFIEDSKEIWTHGKIYKSINWGEIK